MPPRTQPSNYPAQFAARVAGREKRALGDVCALAKFGVKLARLAPGAASALRHAPERQDEFIYVQGHPTLITDTGETPLAPGMCAGFKGGSGDAHHRASRSATDVLYLGVGDRTAGGRVVYPDDDLAAATGADGRWVFTRKDGTPY